MKPKITFLMNAYQAEKYISKAIESVLKQTEPDVILFIRNNGSTDSTGKIIRKYAARDSRIKFVENKKNAVTDDGIEIMDPRWWPLTPEIIGNYVSFLDSDDWLMPDFSQKMYDAAMKNDSEMVVGGNYFINEKTGGVLGQRTPPNFETHTLKDLGSHFQQTYNSLRTWWGKLYKTDFFFAHYKKAWASIYPATWAPIDTVIVLRYLGLCQRVACIDRPLYCFLERCNSSYNTQTLSIWRLIFARALYQEGLNILKLSCAENIQNQQFLLCIHWGYLCEAIQNVSVGRAQTHLRPLAKMQRLEDLVNDKIVGIYLNSNISMVLKTFTPYIQHCMTDGRDSNIIWDSFLLRLYKILSKYQFNKRNALLFPLLLACVSDPHNENNMGRIFFEDWKSYWSNQSLSKGELFLLELEPNDYLFRHPQDCVYWVNKHDHTDETVQLENELTKAFQKGGYDKVCDLLEAIANQCPFSRVAFYYRIRMAVLIKNMNLALLLVATAKVLWPFDKEIQELYWSLQEEAEEFVP
jgi:glycosyltransferase involved in cell wall biosynthesis